MATDDAATRAALETERARLLGEVAETITAPGQMTYGSQAAAASQVFEQQRDLALRDRATGHLALVDAALERLDDGTYGACLRCGQPIPAGPARGPAVGRVRHRLPADRRPGRPLSVTAGRGHRRPRRPGGHPRRRRPASAASPSGPRSSPSGHRATAGS